MSRRRFWSALAVVVGLWAAIRGLTAEQVSVRWIADAVTGSLVLVLTALRARATGLSRARVVGLCAWVAVSVAMFVAAVMVIAGQVSADDEWSELTAVGALLLSGSSWVAAMMSWLNIVDHEPASCPEE